MKYYIYTVLTLMIICLIIVFFLNFFYNEGAITQQEQKELQELKSKNKTLLRDNAILSLNISTLNIKADSLTHLIIKDQYVIQKLKTKQDEKNSRIAKFTDDELYRYFARFNAKTEQN